MHKKHTAPASSGLAKTKYAEYIRDFTALGNPFLLALVSASVLGLLPGAAGGRALALVLLFVWNEAVCSGIKFLWHKPRPDGQQFGTALEKVDAGSFPSIHASRILLVYGYLACLTWQQALYFFAFIAPVVILVVGYSRTFLHKHFWVDVLAGYGFGLLWLLLFFGLLA